MMKKNRQDRSRIQQKEGAQMTGHDVETALTEIRDSLYAMLSITQIAIIFWRWIRPSPVPSATPKQSEIVRRDSVTLPASDGVWFKYFLYGLATGVIVALVLAVLYPAQKA
jgi:hypothetical protein